MNLEHRLVKCLRFLLWLNYTGLYHYSMNVEYIQIPYTAWAWLHTCRNPRGICPPRTCLSCMFGSWNHSVFGYQTSCIVLSYIFVHHGTEPSLLYSFPLGPSHSHEKCTSSTLDHSLLSMFEDILQDEGINSLPLS